MEMVFVVFIFKKQHVQTETFSRNYAAAPTATPQAGAVDKGSATIVATVLVLVFVLVFWMKMRLSFSQF